MCATFCTAEHSPVADRLIACRRPPACTRMACKRKLARLWEPNAQCALAKDGNLCRTRGQLAAH
eukprot:361402-Chlamydomonas_euryale.AAC.3